jgi:hypothetical protein
VIFLSEIDLGIEAEDTVEDQDTNTDLELPPPGG